MEAMQEAAHPQLADLLASWRRRMLEDFRGLTKQLPHSGARGAAREQVLIDFLRGYLPGRFGVASGFVVGERGEVSNQTDVVIYDRQIAPVFRMVGDQHLFPAGCTLATVEVKSHLNKTELVDALGKIARVKSFKRSGPQIVGGFRLSSGDVQPLSGFIFAFDSIGLNAVQDQLYEYNRGIPRERWANMICSLEKGIISYVNEASSINISPEAAKWIARTDDNEAATSLAIFYAHLTSQLVGSVAVVPDMFQYVGLQRTNTRDKAIDY